MPPEYIVKLAQTTLETALVMSAPLLIGLALLTLAINVVQVLTSLQDPTISTVPRLLATAAAAVLMGPWLLHKLAQFALQVLGDFRPLLQ